MGKVWVKFNVVLTFTEAGDLTQLLEGPRSLPNQGLPLERQKWGYFFCTNQQLDCDERTSSGNTPHETYRKSWGRGV